MTTHKGKHQYPAIIPPQDLTDKAISEAVDKPMRTLIRKINRFPWMKTMGCCAGKAHHRTGKHFYIILEVHRDSISDFLRFLSLTHALGYNAKYKEKTIHSWSLMRTEISSPNLLQGDGSPTGALMGDAWLNFHIQLIYPTPVTRESTMGTIKAMEMAVDRLASGDQPANATQPWKMQCLQDKGKKEKAGIPARIAQLPLTNAQEDT